MLSTIEALCAETNNWFNDSPVISDYTIEGGSLSLPFIVTGQFFRIVGSKFNDGVYIMGPDGQVKHEVAWSEPYDEPSTWDPLPAIEWAELSGRTLADESFHGAVWPMSIPRMFIKLAEEVKAYNSSDAAKASPFTSESFGGYSYSKSSVSDNSWQKVFAPQLKRWKKI